MYAIRSYYDFGKAMSTVFNTDKTTAAKQAKYKADASKILDNLSKLPKITGTKEEQADILATKYHVITSYSIHYTKLYETKSG